MNLPIEPVLIAMLLGFFPVQLIGSRRWLAILAGLVLAAIAIAWVLMLNAGLTFNEVWIVALVFLGSEFGYGVVTGVLVRAVLPAPPTTQQLWVRAVIAFAPLALLGIALFSVIRDRL